MYKKLGVRANGKQDVETDEIDTKSLKLVELIDYDPKFDQNYLDELTSKAKKRLKTIHPDQWLSNLRGSYEL